MHYLEWLLVFSVANGYLSLLKDQFILSEMSLLGLLYSPELILCDVITSSFLHVVSNPTLVVAAERMQG